MTETSEQWVSIAEIVRHAAAQGIKIHDNILRDVAPYLEAVGVPVLRDETDRSVSASRIILDDIAGYCAKARAYRKADWSNMASGWPAPSPLMQRADPEEVLTSPQGIALLGEIGAAAAEKAKGEARRHRAARIGLALQAIRRSGVTSACERRAAAQIKHMLNACGWRTFADFDLDIPAADGLPLRAVPNPVSSLCGSSAAMMADL